MVPIYLAFSFVFEVVFAAFAFAFDSKIKFARHKLCPKLSLRHKFSKFNDTNQAQSDW